MSSKFLQAKVASLKEVQENLLPWLEHWRREVPQIRAAYEYLSNKCKDRITALKKIQDLLDMGLVFRQ